MGQTTKYHIVYPSDYTAIADIPEAMKDMAESTEDGIDQAVGEIDLSDYYTKEEIDSMIGDLDTILQSLDSGGGVE